MLAQSHSHWVIFICIWVTPSGWESVKMWHFRLLLATLINAFYVHCIFHAISFSWFKRGKNKLRNETKFVVTRLHLILKSDRKVMVSNSFLVQKKCDKKQTCKHMKLICLLWHLDFHINYVFRGLWLKNCPKSLNINNHCDTVTVTPISGLLKNHLCGCNGGVKLYFSVVTSTLWGLQHSQDE